MEDLSVDGTVILKWMLKKLVVKFTQVIKN